MVARERRLPEGRVAKKANERAEVSSAERLAQLAWALAHPARVQIVRLLLKRQACVCGEIVDELPLAQSTVSQHLKILKESGLIQGEVDGPKVCYCIHPLRLKELKDLIASLEMQGKQEIDCRR